MGAPFSAASRAAARLLRAALVRARRPGCVSGTRNGCPRASCELLQRFCTLRPTRLQSGCPCLTNLTVCLAKYRLTSDVLLEDEHNVQVKHHAAGRFKQFDRDPPQARGCHCGAQAPLRGRRAACLPSVARRLHRPPLPPRLAGSPAAPPAFVEQPRGRKVQSEVSKFLASRMRLRLVQCAGQTNRLASGWRSSQRLCLPYIAASRPLETPRCSSYAKGAVATSE